MSLQSTRHPENLTPQVWTRRNLHRRAASASVTVPLTNFDADIAYTIPLSLGTPAKAFNMIIDTGSSITWVASQTCTSPQCQRTKQFDCGPSSQVTCRAVNQSFKATFGSGDMLQGDFYQELIGIGSLTLDGIMGLASVVTHKFQNNVDGVLGLRFTPGGVVSFPPLIRDSIEVLSRFRNTSSLSENKIGLWLRRADSIATSVPGGEITFGGVNHRRFKGQITYLDTLPNTPWTVPIAGLTIGGTRINTTGVSGLIDSGTTVIIVPKNIADAINGAIPGAVTTPENGLWFLPCDGNMDIRITLGTFTVTIPYYDIAILSTSQKYRNTYYCQSSIVFITKSQISLSEWTLGDSFLKNVYSVFDFGVQSNTSTATRIGFAHLSSPGGRLPYNTANLMKTKPWWVHVAIAVALYGCYTLI
ncbi:hypothetical protein BGW38_009563 [Lunasporangiospora selenospora]|uniref:Peptidase A1 domain-containing protein n=1 Tax=Lunasporangiospora selenospora TaxID=979761 RepID=A0A9P6G2X3_9FUNG|nr:hypothetical protein BGW38_009563 [Lunasporangiospora selenospora]